MDAQSQSQSQARPVHNRNTSSSFSIFGSKSDKSNAKPKVDLVETEKERKKAKFNSRAITNPNRALSEAQPALRAQEATTLSQLRAVQHKDWQGNAIADPDSSNPTRSRLERPLDTIRSFEAAIDGGQQRRARMIRAESADLLVGGSSRRSSVIGSELNVHPRSSSAMPGPYMSQPNSRRQSQREPYDPYGRAPPSAYPRRAPVTRMSSAPVFSPRQQYPQDYSEYDDVVVQPQHGYHESYDTTGGSSGMSEPWANSTDPSSENSSVDRIHAIKQPDSGDAYAPGQPDYYPQQQRRSPEGGQHEFRQQQPRGPYRSMSREHPAMRGPPASGQYQRPPPNAYQPPQQFPRRNVLGPATTPASLPQTPQPSSNDFNAASSKGNALRKTNPTPKKEKRQSWLKRTFSRS